MPYDPLPRRCPFDGHPPLITAQLLPPLWWSTTGATQVWRKAEALGAAQVAAKFGVSWVLPALMHHLALAPSEWLQGQPLPGRATADPDFNINTGRLEMVTCKFTPRVPLTRGAQPDASAATHPFFGTTYRSPSCVVRRMLPADANGSSPLWDASHRVVCSTPRILERFAQK